MVTIMDAELVEMLKKTGAVKFGDFTLSSGRKSNYYVDKYVFETNPLCLAAIGDRIAKMIPAGSQRLAGIEIGSIPLAAIASVKSGMPFVIVRKAQKGYGTNKLIEGVWAKGEKVFVVEDVVTTAKGALGAIQHAAGSGPRRRRDGLCRQPRGRRPGEPRERRHQGQVAGDVQRAAWA